MPSPLPSTAATPLTLDDLVDLETYEAAREAYRERVIAHKRSRRVAVGDRVMLLFEDRETLRYQVLEMARVERIHDAAKLQNELDVYNELLPGERTLSATLFIEIPELASIRPELDRLLGLDEHVSIVLGEDDDEQEVRAAFDPTQLQEDRISAVHYLRFPFDEAQAARFADERVRARVRIDHPAYQHEAEVSPPVRESLRRDLRGEAPALLDPERLGRGAARAAAEDEVLFEAGGVRARRPARPGARGHVIVEPREPVPSLLDAEPALLGELFAAVQRVARDVVARHGRARVAVDVDPTGGGLRVHVAAVDP